MSSSVVVIVAVFVLSRVAAFAAGIRFDDGLLHNAYQLLDVRLLHDDPFTSIFYLHSQPPLFNLFTAAVVQLPSGAVRPVLAVIWAGAGLATALLLHATMRRLGVRRWLATTIVCIFLVAPETILTESWFFYSQLQILLSALILYALTRFASTRRTTDGVLFAGSLGALGAAPERDPHRADGARPGHRVAPAPPRPPARGGDRRRAVAAGGRMVGEERARLRQLDQQHLGRDEPLVRRERRRDARRRASDSSPTAP